MRRFFFISTLLMLSATTLSAQQAARLGSRQSIAPLPKELTNDGKSYMALTEYDSKGTKHEVGLYDSFGPSGIKLSVDIPLINKAECLYEKASDYSEQILMYKDLDFPHTEDERVFFSKSDIEAYINIIITLSEFTTLNGDKAFRINTGRDFEKYYWNYRKYGLQYPSTFIIIDESGHLLKYHVDYWVEESVIKMKTNYYETLDENNTYSSKEDIEYYLNQGATAAREVVEFTTLEGDTAYYIQGAGEDLFWNYRFYGTKYPYNIYYISDGYLTMYYVNYRMILDCTNATWTKDPDYSSYSDYEPNVCSFLYMNIDESFYPTTRVLISQNLFNNDDNWEYITFDIDVEQRGPSEAFKYGDGVVRRVYNLRYIYKGIVIMNSVGSQLFYLPLSNEENEWTSNVDIQNVSVLNGLIYILTSEDVKETNSYYSDIKKSYEGIYVIDPKDVSVRSITRTLSRMNINSTVIDKGENLDIQISESGKNDNLTISSMSGQIINSSDISEENPVSVNTGAMPKGIYNVTLRGNGNPTENQRIIIK